MAYRNKSPSFIEDVEKAFDDFIAQIVSYVEEIALEEVGALDDTETVD